MYQIKYMEGKQDSAFYSSVTAALESIEYRYPKYVFSRGTEGTLVWENEAHCGHPTLAVAHIEGKPLW